MRLSTFLIGSILALIIMFGHARLLFQLGKKLVGSDSGNAGVNPLATSWLGSSVDMSSDGAILAIGGFGDNNFIGATWVFVFDGSRYQQLNNKLVGTDSSGSSRQGASVSISSDGRRIAVGGPGDRNGVGAAWVFLYDGSTYQQCGSKLIGIDSSALSNQGFSVSLTSDGEILAVGAPGEDNGAGATFIFFYDGSTYQPLVVGHKLVGTGAWGSSNQGVSVCLSSDGSILAIGGPSDDDAVGATWIFYYNGSTYQQFGSKLVGNDSLGASEQGFSVSLSSNGSIVAIGGYNDDSSAGATWIFYHDGSTYQQLGSKLKGITSSGPSQQGISVSLSSDGGILVVGGIRDNNQLGAAWIFSYNGSRYQPLGGKLVGNTSSAYALQASSVKVSSDGRSVLVGGPRDDKDVGATWVFYYNQSRYHQAGKKLTTGLFAPQQGSSVSLSSDRRILAVGAPADNNYIGATWIYFYNGSAYQQMGNKLLAKDSSGSTREAAGSSVCFSSDGRILAVGGPWNNNRVGAAWIYAYDGSAYIQLGSRLTGTNASGTSFQGFSVSLSSNGSILASGGPVDNLATGATWIFRYDGSMYKQLGKKLVGTGTSGASRQGLSVSLSSDGSILAIGGSGDDGYVGATWIFFYDGSAYQQLNQKLVGVDSLGSSMQGFSLSVSSDKRILAVGGPEDDDLVGATWIFVYNGSAYQQLNNKLVATNSSGPSQQGSSVCVSSDGGILAVGGPSDDNNIGAAWIFVYNGSAYQQLDNKLVGNDSSGPSQQGYSVSLSSNASILAVGGVGDANRVGATWIFFYNGSGYQQLGNKLVGTGATDPSMQGSSVSLSSDGRLLAVGGFLDNNRVGATWIFRYDGSTYKQLGQKVTVLFPSQQGYSVSVSSDGDTISVGGPADRNGVGAAWIFSYDGSTYQQVGRKLVAYDYSGSSQQGWSVSLSSDGNILAVGGPYDDNLIGATWIWVYDESLGNYNQLGDKLVDTGPGISRQGWSVSLSWDGGILAVGAPFDSNGTGATAIFKYDGAAYSQLDKLVGSGYVSPARQGWSVSLSSNASVLAVGGPFDGPRYASRLGSVWLFMFDNSTGRYQQFGDKLVGNRSVGYSSQGSSVSLSSDGAVIAVGGFSDAFGFIPAPLARNGYYTTAEGIGATWLFSCNGSAYNQVDLKLIGGEYVGNSEQGYSVSLSGNGASLTVAIGGPKDNDSIGATWVFSSTAAPPPPPPPPLHCVKPCLTDYFVNHLLCHYNFATFTEAKVLCVTQARREKQECLQQASNPFNCYKANK